MVDTKKTPTLYCTTRRRSFLVTCWHVSSSAFQIGRLVDFWTQPTGLILAETLGTNVKIQNILYAHPARFESFLDIPPVETA